MSFGHGEASFWAYNKFSRANLLLCPSRIAIRYMPSTDSLQEISRHKDTYKFLSNPRSHCMKAKYTAEVWAQQHDEGLDGASPRDITQGLNEEFARHVVRLEDSKCVKKSPCIEEDAIGAEDLQPGPCAAISKGHHAQWAGRWRGLLSDFLVISAQRY